MRFDSNPSERHSSWEHLLEKLEHFYHHTETYKASTYPSRKEVLVAVNNDFNKQRSNQEAIDEVIAGLSKYAVHTPHPNYHGMFNPRPSFPSILADAISANFNPQLAAWGHAPYAVEVEHLLIQEIGKKFGYDSSSIDGVFATGGQEAHITAVLSAFNQKYEGYDQYGLRKLEKTPIIYCSEARHHATIKAARVSGLGREHVKYIAVDKDQRMLPDQLNSQILEDRKAGLEPFFVFATMGTTGSGAIDPINEIAEICKENNLWLHADAAYGGAVVLTKKYNHLMHGIEKADSITFDAHKWLSVPMATSLFITKHPYALGKAFSISANFMPSEEDEIDRLGSYTHSIQWSRRFIGLKLYLPLLVFGWKGFDDTISHQIKIGKYLNQQLEKNGWSIYNNTELPIACFNDARFDDHPEFTKYMYESFLETGEAWIINYQVGNKYTIRACITNYATEEKHIDTLIQLLDKKRNAFLKNKPSIN